MATPTSPDPPYAAASSAAAAAEEERAVGPLLARANLLRLRGQWDEAAVACTEALRLVPNSPSACSLLGDIYEAQRRLDEALQWYGMAVEFDPTNANDRAKLERVAQVQRHALLREEREAELRARRAASAPATRPMPAGAERTLGGRAAHKTLQWFDRLFPPGRWDSAARLILLLCGAITGILLFAAGFVYLSGRDDGRGADAGGSLDAPPPGAVQNVVVTPSLPVPSSPVPNPDESTAVNPVSSLPAGNVPSPVPAPAVTLPAPNNDPALLDALRRAFASSPPASSGGVQVTVAEVDERVPQISLTLSLPAPSGGEAPAPVRDRVLRAAAHAVRVAGERRPRIDRALVRIEFVSPAAPNSLGASTLAFSGETATTAVRAAGGEAAQGTTLRALFVNPVWGAGLAP